MSVPSNDLSVSSALPLHTPVEDSSVNIPSQQHQQHQPFNNLYAANMNTDTVLSPTAIPSSSFQPQSGFPPVPYNIPSQHFNQQSAPGPPSQLQLSQTTTLDAGQPSFPQQQQALFGQQQIPTPIMSQGNKISVVPSESVSAFPPNIPSPFQPMQQQSQSQSQIQPQPQSHHSYIPQPGPYPLATMVDSNGKRLPSYYQPSPLASFEHAPHPTSTTELRGLTPAPLNNDLALYNYSGGNTINNKNSQQFTAASQNVNRGGTPTSMTIPSNLDVNNGLGTIGDQSNSSSVLASNSTSALALASASTSIPASTSGGPSRMTGQYSATDYNKLVNNSNSNMNLDSLNYSEPSSNPPQPAITNNNQPMFNTPIFNQDKLSHTQQFSSLQPLMNQEITGSAPVQRTSSSIQAGPIPAHTLQQYTHVELQDPHNSISSVGGNESLSGSGSGSSGDSGHNSLSGASGLSTIPNIPSGTGLVRGNPVSLSSNLTPTHELSINSASYPPAPNMMYNNVNYGGLNLAPMSATSRPGNYPLNYNETTVMPQLSSDHHLHHLHQQQQEQELYEAQKKKRRHTATTYDMTPETAARNRCSTCGKQFKRPSSLQTHLYSHTGEKLFKCPWPHCGRHFLVKSNMTRHTRLHERDSMKDSQDPHQLE